MRKWLHFILHPKYWPGRLALFFALFILGDLGVPLPAEKSFSRIIYDSKGSLMSAYLTEDDKWRMKCHLDEIAPDLIKSVILKEDRWFYRHPGINPLAIGRAMWSNIISGKRVSGASTITMQLARLMEPKRRSYLNKIAEMFRAFQLEWHYSKDEILELYLSYLPYGGNIEGVKAASLIYFDRTPQKLSLAQDVLLAIIPNRPNSLRLDRNHEAALTSRNWWLNKFKTENSFPKAQLNAALEEPIRAKRHGLEATAPHLSQYLKTNYRQTEIHSTLEPDIQIVAENLLANHVNRIRNKGVTNGAVIIIDNRNSNVIAYCGSADFYDDESSGQVNGVTAVRSPGSALKPALYALAIDKGILTPKMILHDIPVNYGGYTPENYDLTFHGEVTAAYALRNSLNIPPVSLLNTIGVNEFVNFMSKAGFETIRKQKENLGLSTILGGCGVTLEELTRFYSNFANGGIMSPLQYTSQKDTVAKPLYREATAWMIADILSGIQRPDIPNDYLTITNKSPIAWKTGTSFGKRDAWSIGFNPQYTIGVWMGNFDGSGAPDLSGAVMAVPLLFDLFNGIQNEPEQWFPKPKALLSRIICTETGLLPSGNCKHLANDYFIYKNASQKICKLDREIYVSPDSSVQYCTECIPPSKYIKATWPIYKPELTLWFENQHREYRRPPPHNPDCEARLNGEGPRIISPSSDFEYLVEKGAGQEIMLQAASDGRVDLHYWYINNAFYKSSKPGERLFFVAKAGRRLISCMDDKGRENHVEILIKEF